MTTVYTIFAIVGWALTFVFLFGGGEGDSDLDLDVDGGGLAASLTQVLSLRSLVFFAAFFGLTGLVLGWLGTNAAVAFVIAVVLGVFAAWFNARLVAYVKSSDVDTRITDDAIRGSIARVSVPVDGESKGRVMVDVEGQPVAMIARAFHPSRSGFSAGDEVVVVDVRDGVALIAPLDLEVGE